MAHISSSFISRRYRWLSAIVVQLALAGCSMPSPIAHSIPTALPAKNTEAPPTIPTIAEALVATPGAATLISRSDTTTATLLAPTTEPRYVTPEAGAISRQASTSNERVIYIRVNESQNDELWSVTLDGHDDRLLLAPTCSDRRNPCKIMGLATAPTGKQFVYLAGVTLHLVNIDGSHDRIVAEPVDAISVEPFSPKGSEIVFIRYREANPAPVLQNSLWIVPTSGGEPRQIVPWSFFYEAPAWVNDQELIFSQAFTGTPPSNRRIFRVAARGTETPKEIGTGRLVQLAPDRASMLVLLEAEPRNSQPLDVGLAPLDGGAPRRLTQGGGAQLAAWSPDGRTIAIYDQATFNLIIVGPMGEAREELRHLPKRLGMHNLAWDNSGKSLIYWDNEFLLRFDTTLEVELVLTRLGQFVPFAWTVVAVNE